MLRLVLAIAAISFPLTTGAAEKPAVPVNSQASLTKIVGKGFDDETREYPKGLLPAKFVGVALVSGPEDVDLSFKAAWRKPVVLKHAASGAEVQVNCYLRREQRAEALLPKTPFQTLTEPDAEFEAAKFHDLKAATASADGRAVFAFVDGAHLFKVVATGGKKPEELQALAMAAAEAIWAHRHPK
jgi:hypothetical protein